MRRLAVQRPRILDAQGKSKPIGADSDADSEGAVSSQENPGEGGRTSLSSSLEKNQARLEAWLGYGKSFDMLFQPLDLAGQRGLLIALDGFTKDDVLLRITQFLIAEAQSGNLFESVKQLRERGIVYIETQKVSDFETLIDGILSGQAAILVHGLAEAVLIDQRTYPARGPEEPEIEKIIRGPRDGLVETIVFNTALIRRRLRDPNLRFELHRVGIRSKTDVAIGYIEGLTQPALVEEIRGRLQRMNIDGVPMASRTISEYLNPEKPWWNPFPTARYSERPDVLVSHLLEGHVILLADTSPSAIIMPVTFFHHLEHAQEYQEEYVVGTFIRWLRMFGFVVAWFGPALWLGLAINKAWLPESFAWIGPRETSFIPIGLQFILAEVSAGLVWVALIHTPGALATSLGVIGAILLGQQAVEVGLFSQEALLYVAVAFIGTFATPSLELGNAIRLMRLLLLLLTALAGLIGFLVGFFLSILLMATTKSLGIPYLYPLFPLRFRELWAVLFRRPVSILDLRPAFTRPLDRVQSEGFRQK